MNILATSKRRARRAVLDDANDVLIVCVRRESLARVSGTQQLEWLEHVNTRQRGGFGDDRSVRHHGARLGGVRKLAPGQLPPPQQV